MTKEELKEAIAATITENGQKGITGQALANLLNEIVDAAGEGGGGGLTIDSAGMEGPNEHNAQIRQVLIDGINIGVAYPVTMTVFEEVDGGLLVTNYAVSTYGLNGDMFCLILRESPSNVIFLNEDGSLTAEG